MENSNFLKLFANYGSRLWSIVSVFIFVPIYIILLGSDSYGLIGFYALLLGIISFADSGMSSAIIKEFSQDFTSNYKYSVFRRLELIYLMVCISIILIVFLASPLIVDYWIESKTLLRDHVIYNVRIIGCGIATQLISSLYFGAVFALNNQVRANFIQFIYSLLRSGGVIIVLYFISRSIEMYFFWQLICNIIYILVLRFYVLRILRVENTESKLQIEFNKLPSHIVTYISGMIVIAIISAVNIQADKLITSSMFELSIFGFYTMASSLAQLPVILVTPFMAFVFPILSKISESNNKLLSIFQKTLSLVNIFAISVSISIIFYAKEIMAFWSHGSIPTTVFPLIVMDVRLLIIGSLFLALQFPMFYVLLAKGETKFTIRQGVVQLVLGLPLLYLCSKNLGLWGVPIPWIVINLGSVVYLFWIVSTKFIHIKASIYFVFEFLISIGIAILINMFFFYLYRKIESISFIPFALLSGMLTLIALIVAYNKKNNFKLFSFKHLYNFTNE